MTNLYAGEERTVMFRDGAQVGKVIRVRKGDDAGALSS